MGRRRNLQEVQIFTLRQSKGVLQGQDTNLLSVLIQHSDRIGGNLFVNSNRGVVLSRNRGLGTIFLEEARIRLYGFRNIDLRRILK
jgi:hypothetical protein